MPDDLRTRIASLLYGDGNELAWARCTQLADMIMWDLGLKPQYSHGSTYPNVPVIDRTYIRYVTEWTSA